jgi:hypothetical protein
MKASWKIIVILGIFIGSLLWNSIAAFAASESNSDPRQVWMSAGKKGPNEIGLKVWTQKKEGETFSQGEPIILNFETTSKAYVMALNVSPKGDVMVLFPNGESPDNLILPGKIYTLFGPDSTIQVTANEKIREAVIIFYASSKPFKLDPFKTSESQPVIRIPHTDSAQLAALAAKIENLAQDDGFNRQAVILKAAGSSGITLELMAPKSVKPGGVTGGQGLKPEEEKVGKE